MSPYTTAEETDETSIQSKMIIKNDRIASYLESYIFETSKNDRIPDPIILFGCL